MKKKTKKRTGKPRLTVAALAKELRRADFEIQDDLRDLAGAIQFRLSALESERNNRTCTIDDMAQAMSPLIHRSADYLKGDIDGVKQQVDQLSMLITDAQTMIQHLANPPKVARANGVGRSLLRPLLRKLRLAR